MRNKILILGIIVLLSQKIYGQTEFYFGFSGNYSFIPDIEHVNLVPVLLPGIGITPHPTYSLKESYDVKPGFTVNFGFNRHLFRKFSLNSGVGFVYHQYKKESTLSITNNNITQPIGGVTGLPFGFFYGTEPGDVRITDPDFSFENPVIAETPDLGNTRILYLSLPVMIYYFLIPEKLNVGLGVTNYFVAHSSQIRYNLDYGTQPSSLKKFNDKSSDGLNNYQLNGNLTLEYSLFKGIRIHTAFSPGFLSIYDQRPETVYPSVMTGKAKYNTIELGIKYIL
jgi:hypothetical protein